MREKIRGRAIMFTADKVLDDARPKLMAIIGHHVAAGLDRMEAYERAGRDVGRSPAWVQRIIGRRPQATVAAHDWLNLTALCVRIEASAARKEAHAAAIQGQINAARAARQGALQECEGDRSADSGTVSEVVDESRQ